MVLVKMELSTSKPPSHPSGQNKADINRVYDSSFYSIVVQNINVIQ